MIPILFNENETAFTTQGIGALTDAISCTVTEERNGMYELEMTYPITGIHYSDIQYRSIIAAIPSPYRTRQPFRVYKITRPLDGIVTVYAQHLSYDLNAIPVSPFSATGITNAFTQLKSHMAISNNFTFQSGISNTTSQVSYTTPTACRSILGGIQGSILDIFGGEYEWDNWTVRLWANRGADNGVTIRYGKNMTDLSAETDGENTVNGIYPYWQKDDVLVTCNPTIIWVDGAAKNKAVPVEFSNDFEEQPTAAQLQARAEQYLSDNDIGTVPTSIDVSFVDLSKMDEYKGLIASLEKCDLCDTVSVQYEELGVNVKSKIVKIVIDVLKEKYELMEVGTVRADIAQTIATTENKVDNIIRPDGSLIAEALRGFINGSLVNLYAQYDAAEPAGALAILFECNDPANQLYGALALGTQGLMISRTKKADGTGWDWTTALTSQGLMAGIIIAGILTDKTGQNYWNLDTGEAVFGGDAIFKGSLEAASGTFRGTLRVGATSGGGMIVNDVLGNEIMSIDIDGMKINPATSVWGITVSDTLEITGGLYGSIFSKCPPNNATTYITQNVVGVAKGLDGNNFITNHFVELGVSGNQGHVAITNPDNVAEIYARMDADGFYTSGTKARLVNTKNYGKRFEYCYEMPSPFFGDIGTAKTDENGACVIDIDDVFFETVDSNIEYQVFLQKESQGDLWVDSKNSNFFIVKGTPNLKFSWELKMRQKDYGLLRLEENLDNSEDDLFYDAIGFEIVNEETNSQENLVFDASAYFEKLEGVLS